MSTTKADQTNATPEELVRWLKTLVEMIDQVLPFNSKDNSGDVLKARRWLSDPYSVLTIGDQQVHLCQLFRAELSPEPKLATELRQAMSHSPLGPMTRELLSSTKGENHAD